MYIVLLRFSVNKALAADLMEAHKAWLDQGFEDGVFLLTGSLPSKLGGGILAHNTSLGDLKQRVNADPFVANDVVSAEILELTPTRADGRLDFLRH